MYLKDINFAIWCDFIERDFLKNEFSKLINKNINGATTNPAIFNNAFLNSSAYKEQKESLKGKDPKEIYEELATYDIKEAANILYPLYQKGDDGFISIEVDPNLCNDAKETIKEAKRLHQKINKENIMIKIPATKAGYEAMKELTKEGFNINATLIFSPDQAKYCLDAISDGLASLQQNKPKSVISIFVSRFDKALDPFLPNELRSKTGILNATSIYHLIQKSGIDQTRALFASTSVKSDDLKPTYYVEELCFKNSINTAPTSTIKATFQENLTEKKPSSQEEIDEFFKDIKKTGINIQKTYQTLLDEGLEAFIQAYNQILSSLK